MLAGRMRHKDHRGNEGTLVAGGVQWMTAGRGIIHSEMPLQDDGLMWGFQLWVNLPARDKMGPPRYQEFGPDAIPEGVGEGGARVRVIAGEAQGITGPVRGIVTNPLYLDVRVPRASASPSRCRRNTAPSPTCSRAWPTSVRQARPGGSGRDSSRSSRAGIGSKPAAAPRVAGCC